MALHFRNSNKKTPDSGNFLYQQCTVCWQSMYKTLCTSAEANSSLTAIFVKLPETLQFQVFVSDVIHKNLKLECFEVTPHKPL